MNIHSEILLENLNVEVISPLWAPNRIRGIVRKRTIPAQGLTAENDPKRSST